MGGNAEKSTVVNKTSTIAIGIIGGLKSASVTFCVDAHLANTLPYIGVMGKQHATILLYHNIASKGYSSLPEHMIVCMGSNFN